MATPKESNEQYVLEHLVIQEQLDLQKSRGKCAALQAYFWPSCSPRKKEISTPN